MRYCGTVVRFPFSNKFSAATFAGACPRWRGFELYGEGALDDFDARRLRSQILRGRRLHFGASLAVCSNAVRSAFARSIIKQAFAITRTATTTWRAQLDISAIRSARAALGGYSRVDWTTRDRLDESHSPARIEVRSGNTYGSASPARTSGLSFRARLDAGRASSATRVIATWTIRPRSTQLR